MLFKYVDVNMIGFLDIGLVECFMKCFVYICMGYINCVGVFYNLEI